LLNPNGHAFLAVGNAAAREKMNKWCSFCCKQKTPVEGGDDTAAIMNEEK
jgi:hypothetical protein